LAYEITRNHLDRDKDGYIAAPDAPGLGIEIDTEAARQYLVDVEIKAKGELLFSSSAQI
jgi:L-alanine-DL-glutamate epimerase-like enolase superfamily enzyme